jgi:hypothetical protein
VKKVELYLHSQIRLHVVVFNSIKRSSNNFFKTTMLRELILFPSSDELDTKEIYCVGPLDRPLGLKTEI